MQTVKVLALIGSPRRAETLKVVEAFGKRLESFGAIDFEYLFLKDYNLGICTGCFSCLSKGETHCPHRDDLGMLLRKIAAADGVIFATPNYALQVTAIMKNLLDRMAFVFHRPRYFDKTSLAIVTQGIYGGGAIVKYLSEVARWWGFKIVKGFYVSTIAPRTPAEQKEIDQKIDSAARRFVKVLRQRESRSPSLYEFVIFRMVRSMYRVSNDHEHVDYCYYRDQGWLESDYYYPIRIGWVRKMLGKAIDRFGARAATKRNQALAGK